MAVFQQGCRRRERIAYFMLELYLLSYNTSSLLIFKEAFASLANSALHATWDISFFHSCKAFERPEWRPIAPSCAVNLMPNSRSARTPFDLSRDRNQELNPGHLSLPYPSIPFQLLLDLLSSARVVIKYCGRHHSLRPSHFDNPRSNYHWYK